MNELSQKETERYQRHLSLPGFGLEGQLKLRRSRVLVIGAGGLGCPALQYLAAAGVGRIGIIDGDRVERSNLQRQILFTEADIGAPKAETAARRLREMNPEIDYRVHSERLTAANARERIRDYDLVIDGSDNFPTRYLVNDACVLEDKPFIYGALQGFEGQVSVLNFRGGPTYRCLFPAPPDPEHAPNCAELGVLGILPGSIGTLQATEAIKLLTGTGTPLSGKLLLFDARTHEQKILRFDRVAEAAAIDTVEEISYQCGSPAEESEDEISPEALHAALHNGLPVRGTQTGGGWQVIDVREDWERALGTLDSTHIPLGQLVRGEVDPADLGLRPDRPTCVYCKAGSRSMKALGILRSKHGFKQIRNLRGGITAWAETIDPAVAP